LDNLDENFWLNDRHPTDQEALNVGGTKLQSQAHLFSPPLTDSLPANKKIQPSKPIVPEDDLDDWL
jgi:hypothetical protein